jgi:ABC-type maltose transport system permease subunit
VRRTLEIITAPLWLPALAVLALMAYVAGWVDWMANKR